MRMGGVREKQLSLPQSRYRSLISYGSSLGEILRNRWFHRREVSDDHCWEQTLRFVRHDRIVRRANKSTEICSSAHLFNRDRQRERTSESSE